MQMAKDQSRKDLVIRSPKEAITSYQAFLNGLLNFLNLHFTESFNFQEGLACGAMDRLYKATRSGLDRNQGAEALEEAQYSNGIEAIGF